MACWLRFSDGTRTPLDLFDPSTYVLAVSSMDKRVASVPRTSGRIAVVVAESEGQGALIRAVLAVPEVCQRSRRRSKLAVGTGNVRVRLVSGERAESEALVNGGIVKTEMPTMPMESGLQEEIGKAKSTIKATPCPEKVPTNILIKGHGNLMEPSNQDQTKRSVPMLERGLASGIFLDLEIWIYILIGVACLGIMLVLIRCTAYPLNASGKKLPLHCQHPEHHAHHWVRLATPAEQSCSVPVRTLTQPEMASPSKMSQEMPAHQERTATLGRRSATLPPGAGPLARPTRNEPLHSPTSKRNQVEFTTFTTLDIKHLAALKRNWLEFGWHSQGRVGHSDSQERPEGQTGIREPIAESCQVNDGTSDLHCPAVKPEAEQVARL